MRPSRQPKRRREAAPRSSVRSCSRAAVNVAEDWSSLACRERQADTETALDAIGSRNRSAQRLDIAAHDPEAKPRMRENETGPALSRIRLSVGPQRVIAI